MLQIAGTPTSLTPGLLFTQEHGLQRLPDNESDSHGASAGDASASSSSSAQSAAAAVRHSISLRQVYVTTWGSLCFLGLVGIAAAFIVQRINDEARMDSPFGDKPVLTGTALLQSAGGGLSSGMSKGTAMLLCFAYASLAWLLSNGIIANPRGKGLAP